MADHRAATKQRKALEVSLDPEIVAAASIQTKLRLRNAQRVRAKRAEAAVDAQERRRKAGARGARALLYYPFPAHTALHYSCRAAHPAIYPATALRQSLRADQYGDEATVRGARPRRQEQGGTARAARPRGRDDLAARGARRHRRGGGRAAAAAAAHLLSERRQGARHERPDAALHAAQAIAAAAPAARAVTATVLLRRLQPRAGARGGAPQARVDAAASSAEDAAASSAEGERRGAPRAHGALRCARRAPPAQRASLLLAKLALGRLAARRCAPRRRAAADRLLLGLRGG
eukprot:scaffold87028_cov61-Phaeocystis_antarctica.AAC.7